MHNLSPKSLMVIVDDREQDMELLQALMERDDVRVETQRLDLGDYSVEHAILFERKSAMDFGRSLIDGRLFAQASRLAGAHTRPAMILQGTPAEWRDTGIRRDALQGALITLMLVFDLPVFRANDSLEAARLLVYTARQMLRLRQGGQGACRMLKGKRPATRKRRILQSLPGIGAERAQLLLDHFGSVEACIRAPVEALMEVDGIGPKTAESIRNTVSEDPGLYAPANMR